MSFDRRLGELLDYKEVSTAALDPAPIIRRARRRRARRTGGTAAAVLAVAVTAAVAAGAGGPGERRPALAAAPTTTTLTGTASSAPAPSPSATKAIELSPVRVTLPGEHFTVYGGLEMWVTATEKCTSEQTPGFSPSTECRDSDSDNLQGPAAGRRDQKPTIGGQSSWRAGEPMLCTGIYLGQTPPARIVVTDHGVQNLATIVTTPGMDGWVAYYVVLPNSVPGTPPATPLPQASRTGLALTAYDAGGNLLAGTPPAAF